MKIPRPRLLPVCLLPFFLAWFAGCESKPDRRAAMEEARREVPPMAANESFFDGRIAVHLTLGSSLGGIHSGGNGPSGASSPSGTGGYGGGSMRGGHHGRGGAAPSSGADGSDQPQAHLVDSPMPPAMLRVRLENTSAESITVEIRDLNSDLGDFATNPDKFTLEPGKSDEPESMQSLLGVDSYALPVTLTLRVDGKTESKILTLRPIPPPPSPAPTPATP